VVKKCGYTHIYDYKMWKCGKIDVTKCGKTDITKCGTDKGNGLIDIMSLYVLIAVKGN
jgi:hypothetical protein